MRSQILEELYNALLGIPISSVEAQRCFSTPEKFSTKLRSNLSDGTLSSLVFLKHNSFYDVFHCLHVTLKKRLSESVNILHLHSISFISRSYLQSTLVKIIQKKFPGKFRDLLGLGVFSPRTNHFPRSQDQKVSGLKICKSPRT